MIKFKRYLTSAMIACVFIFWDQHCHGCQEVKVMALPTVERRINAHAKKKKKNKNKNIAENYQGQCCQTRMLRDRKLIQKRTPQVIKNTTRRVRYEVASANIVFGLERQLSMPEVCRRNRSRMRLLRQICTGSKLQPDLWGPFWRSVKIPPIYHEWLVWPAVVWPESCKTLRGWGVPGYDQTIYKQLIIVDVSISKVDAWKGWSLWPVIISKQAAKNFMFWW